MTDSCICSAPRFPDGTPVNVTVGCRVHHLMADGAPAADHETRCMCGNFVDDRDWTLFTDDGGDLLEVCMECKPWADGQEHLTMAIGGEVSA